MAKDAVIPPAVGSVKQTVKILITKGQDENYIVHHPQKIKIYTSIDSRMQKHAEKAVEAHFKSYLQEAFDKNNKKCKNPPFSNDISRIQIDTILNKSCLLYTSDSADE